MDIDKQIKKTLGKKSHSFSSKPPISLSSKESNIPSTKAYFNTRKKKDELLNLAKGSIFFPFTQPTVRSPRGRIIKGRMPPVKRVMKNFFGDKDKDGILSFADNNDINPNNPRGAHWRRPVGGKDDDARIARDIQFTPRKPVQYEDDDMGAFFGYLKKRKREKEEREMLEEEIQRKTINELNEKFRQDKLLKDKDKDGIIAAADNDDNNPNNPKGLHYKDGKVVDDEDNEEDTSLEWGTEIKHDWIGIR